MATPRRRHACQGLARAPRGCPTRPSAIESVPQEGGHGPRRVLPRPCRRSFAAIRSERGRSDSVPRRSPRVSPSALGRFVPEAAGGAALPRGRESPGSPRWRRSSSRAAGSATNPRKYASRALLTVARRRAEGAALKSAPSRLDAAATGQGFSLFPLPTSSPTASQPSPLPCQAGATSALGSAPSAHLAWRSATSPNKAAPSRVRQKPNSPSARCQVPSPPGGRLAPSEGRAQSTQHAPGREAPRPGGPRRAPENASQDGKNLYDVTTRLSAGCCL